MMGARAAVRSGERSATPRSTTGFGAAPQGAVKSVSVLGATGITFDAPVIRHMNNLESVITYEGTEEIHTLIVGAALTGLRAFG